MQLKDKVIVITGGNKGLGACLATVFEREGARLAIVARDKSLTFSADVSDEAQVNQVAKKIVDTFGRIDIWINNAGVWLPHAPMDEVGMEDVRKMFEVNVYGLMYGSRSAVEHRVQCILNMCSTSALGPRPKSGYYSASKFAVDGFTKAIRVELNERGIKVLSVFPAGMKTELFDKGRPENFAEYMDPNEVAEKIVANMKLEEPVEELVLDRPRRS